MSDTRSPQQQRIDPRSAAPMYTRIKGVLRDEALRAGLRQTDAPLALPSEAALMQRFNVSRGTIRQALQELVHEGLLYREQGRGTFVNPTAQIRAEIWERLRAVARPDARFHYDFAHFIPDYEGSEQGTARILDSAVYQRAELLFITPDNNLRLLRERVLGDGKRCIVSTPGLSRGFVLLDGQRIHAHDRRLAATLEGMEEFASPLSVPALAALGSIDLLVTGACAVTETGIRLGKGHGYFDLEWGILSELKLIDQRSPVVVAVHDCQLLATNVAASEYDTIVDFIATPTRWIAVASGLPKPLGVHWTRLTPQSYRQWPVLSEVRAYLGERPAAERTVPWAV